MAKKIKETEISLYDKKIFGDNNEHWYNVDCYNGYAIATLIEEDMDITGNTGKEPKKLRLEYPKRSEVLKNKDLAEEILVYRGLFDLDIKDIHYGDIMLCCGKIVNIL